MVIGIEARQAFTKKRTGVENYAYEIIKHLIKIDQTNQYRLYYQDESFDPIAEGFEGPNVKLIHIGLPRLWTQIGLAWEVIKHPPDVLFMPEHTMPVVRRPGQKVVNTIHDLGAEYLPQYHKFPHKYYLNMMTVYAVNHADKLLAVSESTKNDLVKRLGAREKKIEVVYEGFEKETFHPAEKEEQKKISEVIKKYNIGIKEYMLFVGTVQPRKNLERLIEAFSSIADQIANVDLVIGGGKGWLSDEIYAAPKKFDVEGRVKFIGFADSADLPALYHGASLLTLPSLYEGFGLPVVEAMASGTPVVVSQSSSLPEVVGSAGVIVDPLDVNSIAEGLLKVLKDDKLAKELSEKGLKQAEKFGWDKAATQTLEILEKIGRKHE